MTRSTRILSTRRAALRRQRASTISVVAGVVAVLLVGWVAVMATTASRADSQDRAAAPRDIQPQSDWADSGGADSGGADSGGADSDWADSGGAEPAPTTAAEAAMTNTAGAEAASLALGGPPRSELASQVVPLPSRLRVADAVQLPAPVGIRFDAIGAQAGVDPVGVEPNGEMEIPEAARVGWYEYGPTPGAAGSAVLAGHIAYNGTNGAFRYLDSAQVGDEFFIDFADGSTEGFVVVEVAQYAKTDLPLDQVFSKDGSPALALITCGGEFQPSLSSYVDNVVVTAVPL